MAVLVVVVILVTVLVVAVLVVVVILVTVLVVTVLVVVVILVTVLVVTVLVVVVILVTVLVVAHLNRRRTVFDGRDVVCHVEYRRPGLLHRFESVQEPFF